MGWLRLVLVFIFLTALGGWLLVSAVLALRTGRANAAGRLVERAKRPGQFALTVVVQLGFAAIAFALLIALLSDAFTAAP